MVSQGGRSSTTLRTGVVLVLLLAVTSCGRSAPTGGPSPAPEPTRSAGASPTASPTPSPSAPPTASPSPSPSASPTSTPTHRRTALRRGDEGPRVLALQQGLAALGYWLGTADGRYGELTLQAVQALQKAAGLTRDGRAGPRTLAALRRGVLPRAESREGAVVEIDLARQLLLVVRDGRVRLVLSTSTGSGRTYWYRGTLRRAVTPVGRYSVYALVDGLRVSPLGLLWRPAYFHGGIAVHGSPSVPPWPASHGCVRVSYPAMDMLWREGLVPIGTEVRVR